MTVQSEKRKQSGQPHPSHAVRDVGLNLIGLSLPLLAAVFAIPIVIRSLGVERFGILSLGWVAITYFGILDFGTGRAVTRFSAHALHKDQVSLVSEYVWSGMALQLVAGMLAGILMAAATPYLVTGVFNMPRDLEGEARLVFYILATSLPVLMVSASLRGALEAMQRFDLVNLIRAPFSALIYLIPAGVVVSGGGLEMIAWLLVGSQAAGLTVYLATVARLLPERTGRLKLRGTLVRELLSFGGWITVSNLVAPLLVHLDRVMVGAVLSVAAVAYYATPYEIVTRLWFIPLAVVSVLFPRFSAWDGGAERPGPLMARGMKIVLALAGVVVLVLVGSAEQILKLWLGSAFVTQSSWVLRILAVGVLVNSVAQIPYALLQGAGRPDLPARFHLLELPVHFTLVWIFVALWGLNGAALAWLVRVALDAGLLMVAANQIGLWEPSDLQTEGFFASLVVIVSGLGAAGLVGAAGLAPMPETVALVVIIVGTVFALWRFTMDDADRTKLRSALPFTYQAKRP